MLGAELPVNGWRSLVLLLAVMVALLTRLLLPVLARMLERGGLVAVNFQGRALPNAVGIVVVLPALVALGAATLLGAVDAVVGLSLSFGLSALALLGFVDDTCGDHAYRGWGGHWRALRAESILTTGLLKAIGGGFVGLVTAATGNDTGHWTVARVVSTIVSALFLALATNSLNLFDLRPGRAVKVFTAAILVPLLGLAFFSRHPSGGSQVGAALLWVATAVLVYAPWDLRAKVMMGDAGANPLGFLLGVGWVALLPFWAETAGVLVLGWFQRFAGRASLSDVIARHAWLARIDGWGRPHG